MVNISVIIPTHNRAAVLSKALDSVLCQRHPAQEIIVVDDGSTDQTSRLMQSDYPNVCYIHTAQLGVSHARNVGIKAAQSEWIALLDSDDVWLPHKLQAQVDALEQAPRDYWICHSDEMWIRDGRRVNPKHKHRKQGGWIYPHCLPLCAMSPSAILIHRSVFERVGLFDEDLVVCEDYDLWLRITACYPVLYVDQPLIQKYGGHADQLSQRYWGMDRFRIRALQKMLQSNALPGHYRQMTIEALQHKARVYLAGARKRQKWDEVAYYEKLCQCYPS